MTTWHPLPGSELPPVGERVLLAMRVPMNYTATGSYSIIGPPHWTMDDESIFGEFDANDPDILAWAELPVYAPEKSFADRLRAAGGDAWDKIANPTAYIREMRGGDEEGG